jgi:hypothetical protein
MSLDTILIALFFITWIFNSNWAKFLQYREEVQEANKTNVKKSDEL